MALVVDGAQGEVLVSLQNIVALTHVGFSIASDGSPWRERETHTHTHTDRDREKWDGI